MLKVDAEKAAKIGHVLFRYMRARHRFNEKTDRPLPAHDLAILIGQGKRNSTISPSSQMPTHPSCSMAEPMMCSTRL
jgi:hypothetical protein